MEKKKTVQFRAHKVSVRFHLNVTYDRFFRPLLKKIAFCSDVFSAALRWLLYGRDNIISHMIIKYEPTGTHLFGYGSAIIIRNNPITNRIYVQFNCKRARVQLAVTDGIHGTHT